MVIIAQYMSFHQNLKTKPYTGELQNKIDVYVRWEYVSNKNQIQGIVILLRKYTDEITATRTLRKLIILYRQRVWGNVTLNVFIQHLVCARYCTQHTIFLHMFFYRPYEIGIIILILLVRKLKLGELSHLATYVSVQVGI